MEHESHIEKIWILVQFYKANTTTKCTNISWSFGKCSGIINYPSWLHLDQYGSTYFGEILNIFRNRVKYRFCVHKSLKHTPTSPWQASKRWLCVGALSDTTLPYKLNWSPKIYSIWDWGVTPILHLVIMLCFINWTKVLIYSIWNLDFTPMFNKGL